MFQFRCCYLFYARMRCACAGVVKWRYMSDEVSVIPMGDNTSSHAPAVVAGRNGGRLTPIRSQADAQRMARKRWDKRSRVAREALVAAGVQFPELPAKFDAYDVARVLYTQHAQHAYDPSARGSVSSLEAVVNVAFPKPERDIAVISAPVAGDAGELRELLDAFRAWKAARLECGSDNSNYDNQSGIAPSAVMAGDVMSDAD